MAGEKECDRCQRREDECYTCHRSLNESDFSDHETEVHNGPRYVRSASANINGRRGSVTSIKSEPRRRPSLPSRVQLRRRPSPPPRARSRDDGERDERFEKFYKRQKTKDSKAISILVYRNGDKYDQGTIIRVTKKKYKHWLNLLDYLAKKMDDGKPINVIYDLEGNTIRTFKGMKDGHEYVAAAHKFQDVGYGNYKNKKWNHFKKVPRHKSLKLTSRETDEMYLEQHDYKPDLHGHAAWRDKDFDRKHMHDNDWNDSDSD